MKQVTNKEIKEIAERIVDKTNESTSDYDAVDDVTSMLRAVLKKMEIAVEGIKKNPNCKCESCECEK
jgi:hypothetical protein